jgi:hypothetical protein
MYSAVMSNIFLAAFKPIVPDSAYPRQCPGGAYSKSDLQSYILHLILKLVENIYYCVFSNSHNFCELMQAPQFASTDPKWRHPARMD